MSLVLNLAPELESQIVAEAERLNLTLEEYLVEKSCLMADVCVFRAAPAETTKTEGERIGPARSRYRWPL